MIKKNRQELILKIIEEHSVSNQEILRNLLLSEYQIDVTQATLSRDIRELGLTKEPSGYYKYTENNFFVTECPQLLIDAVLSIEYALNTVVIKCQAGMAQAVCAVIDRFEHSEIVGTLAGDDTIFVLLPDEKSASIFTKNLRDYRRK